MSQKTDRQEPAAAVTPVPRKRFRVEKLEERIAPKKGGNGTNNCGGGNSGQSSGSSGSYISIY